MMQFFRYIALLSTTLLLMGSIGNASSASHFTRSNSPSSSLTLEPAYADSQCDNFRSCILTANSHKKRKAKVKRAKCNDGYRFRKGQCRLKKPTQKESVKRKSQQRSAEKAHSRKQQSLQNEKLRQKRRAERSLNSVPPSNKAAAMESAKKPNRKARLDRLRERQNAKLKRLSCANGYRFRKGECRLVNPKQKELAGRNKQQNALEQGAQDEVKSPRANGKKRKKVVETTRDAKAPSGQQKFREGADRANRKAKIDRRNERKNATRDSSLTRAARKNNQIETVIEQADQQVDKKEAHIKRLEESRNRKAKQGKTKLVAKLDKRIAKRRAQLDSTSKRRDALKTRLAGKNKVENPSALANESNDSAPNDVAEATKTPPKAKNPKSGDEPKQTSRRTNDSEKVPSETTSITDSSTNAASESDIVARENQARSEELSEIHQDTIKGKLRREEKLQETIKKGEAALRQADVEQQRLFDQAKSLEAQAKATSDPYKKLELLKASLLKVQSSKEIKSQRDKLATSLEEHGADLDSAQQETSAARINANYAKELERSRAATALAEAQQLETASESDIVARENQARSEELSEVHQDTIKGKLRREEKLQETIKKGEAALRQADVEQQRLFDQAKSLEAQAKATSDPYRKLELLKASLLKVQSSKEIKSQRDKLATSLEEHGADLDSAQQKLANAPNQDVSLTQYTPQNEYVHARSADELSPEKIVDERQYAIQKALIREPTNPHATTGNMQNGLPEASFDSRTAESTPQAIMERDTTNNSARKNSGGFINRAYAADETIETTATSATQQVLTPSADGSTITTFDSRTAHSTPATTLPTTNELGGNYQGENDRKIVFGIPDNLDDGTVPSISQNVISPIDEILAGLGLSDANAYHNGVDPTFMKIVKEAGLNKNFKQTSDYYKPGKGSSGGSGGPGFIYQDGTPYAVQGECVALSRALTGMGEADTWEKGDNALLGTLKPGEVVATFGPGSGGKYDSKHTGVFLSYVNSDDGEPIGWYMLDQNNYKGKTDTTKKAGIRRYISDEQEYFRALERSRID